MKIHLAGLNEMQREIAERIWKMSTRDEVVGYLEGLPRRARQQGWAVYHFLVAEIVDQLSGDELPDVDDLIDLVKQGR